MEIPKDPSLKDLQVFWESLFWYKSKMNWVMNAATYERWVKFFGADRKPRDIFRADVLEYQEWLHKKGKSEKFIAYERQRGQRFYRWLDERELVEKDFNPFKFQF